MKKLVINKNNLELKDINEFVYRPRAIIINSNNEILLGFCNHTYQFPGGFLEDNETLIEGLKREILEETGILLNDNEIIKQICTIEYLNKNYPRKDNNRLTKFSYYYVVTDKKVNLNNTNFDEWEKKNNFKLKYVFISDFEKVLNETINDNPMNKMIYKDMMFVFNLLKKEI